MALDNLMKGLMQSGSDPQGQQGSGGDPMSEALGGMMGGGAPGGSASSQMLGALEGIIGGKPGTGKPLPQNAGNAANPAQAGGPAMSVVQPLADRVAEKVGVSPQIATVVSSIALHYLLSSHPSSGAQSRLDYGSTMQELKTGGLSPDTLKNSGMVNDVTQATGLDQNKAVRSLNTVFSTLASHA